MFELHFRNTPGFVLEDPGHEEWQQKSAEPGTVTIITCHHPIGDMARRMNIKRTGTPELEHITCYLVACYLLCTEDRLDRITTGCLKYAACDCLVITVGRLLLLAMRLLLLAMRLLLLGRLIAKKWTVSL